MNKTEIINWLLQGDVSIQYQALRDLQNLDDKILQKKIAVQGWGLDFLSRRNNNGHWGIRFYQPKWVSTHYTLLDLRNLNLPPDNSVVKDTIELVLKNDMAMDGGLCLSPSSCIHSDVCVNGMFLNYASYFLTPENSLKSIVDCILKEVMPDGGFNCRTIRGGASHSSLHTTISVLEGFTEFLKAGNDYRKEEIKSICENAVEFILMHKFFLSDKTEKIIHHNFLRFPYPYRWKYDILRALDYFQYSGIDWDYRMQDAVDIIRAKQNSDGTLNLNAPYSGQVHFIMEKSGSPSRWNTLRALRIFKKYKIA